MDQNNDVIQALLSDPEKLSAAISVLGSVFGPQNGAEEEKRDPDEPPAEKEPVSVIKSSDGIALLRALKPFLPKEKQDRVDRAVKMLALADLASNFKDIL